MGLLETAPEPPPPQNEPRRQQARALASAGGLGPKLALRNRFAPLEDPKTQCSCSEAHALFEKSSESEVPMPPLGSAKLKPEFHGYEWPQVASPPGSRLGDSGRLLERPR
eukprot:7679398-Alexandrium_andersonii.AAC.1